MGVDKRNVSNFVWQTFLWNVCKIVSPFALPFFLFFWLIDKFYLKNPEIRGVLLYIDIGEF
jgi:hypothetical protein